MDPELSTSAIVNGITEGWTRERPDFPVRTVAPITRIWRLARLLQRERDRSLAGLGIDQATLELLANLRRSGAPYALRPGRLAGLCGVTPAAISLRIRRAEARGWVQRAPDPTERRAVMVRLTPTGRRAADEFAGVVLRHDEDLLADVADEDLDALCVLLDRLERSAHRAGNDATP